jgi:phage terminase large subunit
MYAMLAEGKFIKPAGTYFKEFVPGIHVVEPFVIPNNWTRYRSIDYGLDMLAVLWFAVSPTNEVYTYKELHESDRIISDAARRILEVNGDDKIRCTYAPPDLWSRTKDTGKSIQETFATHGVPFYKSSNARVEGWLAVKEAIKPITTKDPVTGKEVVTSNLRVFSNCVNLIKNIQAIQRDEKDPNDCATEPHDITHICDSLRGYCIVRYANHRSEVKEPKSHINSNQVNNYAKVVTKWK